MVAKPSGPCRDTKMCAHDGQMARAQDSHVCFQDSQACRHENKMVNLAFEQDGGNIMVVAIEVRLRDHE